MALAAGVPEMVGAVGEPTLTEPALWLVVLRVCPPLTPTWPQPGTVAIDSTQRMSPIARPRRALATFIDTPCFSRSRSLVCELRRRRRKKRTRKTASLLAARLLPATPLSQLIA